MKKCQHCNGPIPPDRRQDAQYCKEQCRNLAYQRRLRHGLRSSELPAEMQELGDFLLARSPAAAIGVRCLLSENAASPMVYPPRGRKSRRFDGTFSNRPYFLLKPFEPPRVPQARVYQVEFVDAQGAVLPTPYGLTAGVYVPLASRMCLPGKSYVTYQKPA